MIQLIYVINSVWATVFLQPTLEIPRPSMPTHFYYFVFHFFYLHFSDNFWITMVSWKPEVSVHSSLHKASFCMLHVRLNWPLTLHYKPERRLHRSTIGVKSSECSSVANGSSATPQDLFSLAAKWDKTKASPIRGINATLSPMCLCLSLMSQILLSQVQTYCALGEGTLSSLADSSLSPPLPKPYIVQKLPSYTTAVVAHLCSLPVI